MAKKVRLQALDRIILAAAYFSEGKRKTALAELEKAAEAEDFQDTLQTLSDANDEGWVDEDLEVDDETEDDEEIADVSETTVEDLEDDNLLDEDDDAEEVEFTFDVSENGDEPVTSKLKRKKIVAAEDEDVSVEDYSEDDLDLDLEDDDESFEDDLDESIDDDLDAEFDEEESELEEQDDDETEEAKVAKQERRERALRNIARLTQ